MMRAIRKIGTTRTGYAMFLNEDSALQVARWCGGYVTHEYRDDRPESKTKILTVVYGPKGAEKRVRLDEWLIHFNGEFFAAPDLELIKRFEFVNRSAGA